MRKVLLNMPEILIDKIAEYAKENGLKKSEATRELIRRGLDYEETKKARRADRLAKEEQLKFSQDLEKAQEIANHLWKGRDRRP